MDINFELYKVFYHVAKHLSFSEASQELFISQSAVSQSISLLEKKLNCKLLFRSTKKVSLSHEGKILFEHIEQGYNFIKSGERSVLEMHSVVQGDVRIGASDTICKYYLLPYLKKFNSQYPNVKIHITNRTSPDCIELLRKGYVDFAVINIPKNPEYADMEVRELKTINDVFIAGKTFEHLKGKKISIKDLKSYPILALEKNTSTRDFFDNYIKSSNIKVTPEIELGSNDLLIEMAKIGLGISFVMSFFIEEYIEKGDIFILDIKEEIPSRSLGVITHKSIPLTVASRRFIDILG
ncbi:HTH-type transcriptional activator CmpR [Oxobacter pfennigii]|uniref:HTH-type transcriptional activator CmpR n=1 Tax=Oxobacter pfennigii TaxID=36849 RepID=A0A0P8WTC7_9CLOT|nr:LysR family transcriptional regulator [Oxobacter pfennigii]KPU45886.1 HTH-type transcriptional activator CmpR [Oxobacter pfennigii]